MRGFPEVRFSLGFSLFLLLDVEHMAEEPFFLQRQRGFIGIGLAQKDLGNGVLHEDSHAADNGCYQQRAQNSGDGDAHHDADNDGDNGNIERRAFKFG